MSLKRQELVIVSKLRCDPIKRLKKKQQEVNYRVAKHPEEEVNAVKELRSFLNQSGIVQECGLWMEALDDESVLEIAEDLKTVYEFLFSGHYNDRERASRIECTIDCLNGRILNFESEKAKSELAFSRINSELRKTYGVPNTGEYRKMAMNAQWKGKCIKYWEAYAKKFQYEEHGYRYNYVEYQRKLVGLLKDLPPYLREQARLKQSEKG